MKASCRMLHLMMIIPLLVPTASGGSDIYVKAIVDPGGEQLQITTKVGRTILVKKEGLAGAERVGFGDPIISEDGKAVGWTDS